MKANTIIFAMLLVVAIPVVIIVSLDAATATPKFSTGQAVAFKLAPSLKVMIVQERCTPKQCLYQVRVFTPQTTTDTRLFGSDGPLNKSPISIIYSVREFELEGIPNE